MARKAIFDNTSDIRNTQNENGLIEAVGFQLAVNALKNLLIKRQRHSNKKLHWNN